MAAKTVILRPTKTIGYEGNITVKPAETEMEDWYKLVNESEQDGWATYIKVGASDPEGSVTLGFDCPQIGSISAIRVVAWFEATKLQRKRPATVTAIKKNGDIIGSEDIVIVCDNNTTSSVILEGNADCTSIIPLPASADIASFQLKLTGVKPTKPQEVTYSQVYMEVTCEESLTSIYLRQNGIWEAVEGTVYRRENGAWVQSDTDVFAEGDKFTLMTV